MAPVVSDAVDAPVDPTGQWIATVLTYALAVAAVAWLAMLCRRERIGWPLLVALGGGLTCLLEPLFDHLYGLWFYEQGQWNLYTTFGSAQPVWVPAAYLSLYGAGAVIVARILARRPTMRTVAELYLATAAMALVAEIIYVSVLGVYSYQDSQPFVVLGYPVFLCFVNAMAVLIGGIVVYRLVPLLAGAARASLVMVVPLAFAMDQFGGGIVYLSVRHSVDDPPMWLVHVAALTVVAGTAAIVRLLGTLLVAGEAPGATAATAPAEATARD